MKSEHATSWYMVLHNNRYHTCTVKIKNCGHLKHWAYLDVLVRSTSGRKMNTLTLLISTWLADSDRNRKLRLCPTDYRKVDLNIQGKWPVYFWFLNSFCMWFASKEQSRILIRHQYFFCNRKTRWQLPLYSEINLNVRIYHGKYDTFVSLEILSASFKIIISMRWNVILNAVNVLISSLTLVNHILV